MNFRHGSCWFATGETSGKDRRYLYKISWISTELFAEHIAKMLLKHLMKFTAAEISEIVKIMKQDIDAPATTRNEMLLLLMDGLDCFPFVCSKHILSGNLNNTDVCYNIR